VKISCPACSAKYSIADDKVQERLAKIRCRKCGATIVIDGKTSPPHVYTASGEGAEPASTADPGGAEYSVDFGEGDQRTMPLREIVRAYHSGQITGDTYVWTDGFTDWKPLADVPELVSAVGSGPSSNAPSPWDVRSGRPSAEPRAASRTSVRPSGDLFGGISRAGAEDEVATSAPEQPSSTGSRNESSVLFSLSALTSAAQAQRPSTRPAARGAVSEDSGLIDLKALTAAAVKSDANASAATAAVPAVAPLAPPLGATAPLNLAPPLGGIATSADVVAAQGKSRAPLIVGSLIGIGMIAVAAALMLRPAAPPPPEPVVVAAPPAPTPAPTPTAAPTPEPVVAAPPATGAPEEEPEPAEKKASTTKARPRPAPRKSSSTSTASASDDKPAAAKTQAAPAPKKSSSNCGCPPADLQCAMRCAAKKK